MVEYSQQSPTLVAKTHGYGHPHNFITGLQIVQYRSYQRVISIYHLRTHLLSLHLVQTVLQSQKDCLNKLTSFDPLYDLKVVEGDEIPPGCIEVAYLPSVLHGHGSALALRTKKKPGKVEWFVFSRPAEDTILSQLVCTNGSVVLQKGVSLESPHRVFDIVGYVEKGLATRTVRGANREHKAWHDSLCAAEKRTKNLKLTWRGFGAELGAEHDRRRLNETDKSLDKQDEG